MLMKANFEVSGIVHETRELKAKASGNVWRRLAAIMTAGLIAEIVVDEKQFAELAAGEIVSISGVITGDRKGGCELVARAIARPKGGAA